MSKKLLSLILALTLLLGALSCGFVLADTEPVAPTATDKGDYTLQAVADKNTTYADWLKEVMSGANMLKGLTPTLYKEAALTNTGSVSFNPGISASVMTDGNIPGNTDNSTSNANKGFWNAATYPYLFYDLGGVVQIEQFLLGSSVGEGNQDLVIYASESLTNLISNGNLVVNETAVFTAVITPDTPISARYLAFHIVGASNYARVSELGVYTSTPATTDKGDYTVEMVNDPAFGDYMAGIMANNTNLLKSAPPKTYANADFVNGTAGGFHAGSNTGSYLVDNNIPGITDTMGNSNHKVFWQTTVTPYLYYDLGGMGKLKKLLIAGSYPEYASVYKNVLGEIKVYMGNDPATLVSTDNLVATETIKVAATITLDTAIEARYVAILFGGDGGYARVSELALYAENNTPLVVPPVVNDKGDYTETVVSTPNQAHALAEALARPNLAKGLTPKTYADTDFVNSTAGSVSVDNGYSVDNLTDGVIPGISNDETNHRYKVFWNCNTNPYLFYDLNGIATIDQLLLAGSYPEHTSLGDVKVYLGNDPATLVTNDNLVAESTVVTTSVFTFDTAIQARYVAIWFGGTGNYARVSELGIYGIAPTGVDMGDYTETTVNSSDKANLLTEALARKNIVAALTPATYADADFVNGTAGSVSVDYGYSVTTLTDGVIPGITNDETGTNYKVFWNCQDRPYLYYDLGGKGAIEQLIVAGSVPENVPLGDIKVYLGNDPATLVTDSNLVIDTTVQKVKQFSFKTPVECRYIAIFFGGYGNYARVSELGIYGTAPDGIDRGSYILNNYVDMSDTDKLTQVLNKTNVIDCLPPAVYKDTDFVNDVAGAITNYNTAMTDGKIPGITTVVTPEDLANSNIYKGHWNSTTSPYLHYDLKGEATIENILLAGSYPENQPLGNVKIYLGNDLETLISDSNLIADENVGFASLLTLKTSVTCRYIAVHFLASYARVSELGFYSSTGYAQPIAPNGTKITVTPINSPADKATLETFTSKPNWLALAGAYRPTVHSEVPLKESVKNPLVEGGNDKTIADNCVPGISNDEDSSKQKIYWESDETPYLLFDMGIACKEIKSILIAGSYTELTNYGSSLGEVKLYIGNDMATLIQEQNCYAELPVSACSVVTLPEAIDARYVAFWFGGNGGYARVSEVGVYSDYIPEAINLPNEFTADSPVGKGKVKIKIQRNLSDMYDSTLLKSIKGVRLVEKAMPKDMPESIDNGWLSPKGDKMYTLELYDKNGKAISFDEEHMIIVQLPNMDSKANTMGIYKDGELTRPWNIIPTADRKTMLVGQDFGNEGTLYYSTPLQLVFLKFNTPDEVRELTGKREFNRFSLGYSDGTPIIKY